MTMQGKTVIVTGGAKGIGLGIVRGFLTENASVVIADRDRDTGAKVVAEINSPQLAFRHTNVSDSVDVQGLIAFAVERYGSLDALVNNAGYHISKSVERTSEQEWDQIITNNLTSTFLCCKYAIPHLRKSRGAIVNISSMVGLVGQANAGAYSASKGGQIAMSKGMALDLAGDGIRVNVVCPGWVQTPLVEDWFGQQPDPDAARSYIYGVHPMGRIATIDEIAQAVVFLASERAGYITGVALPVDGAVTLGY